MFLVSYAENLGLCKLVGGELARLLGAAGARHNLETNLITLNQNLGITPELLMVVVNKNQQFLALFASYIEGQDIREACINSFHGFSREEIREALYSALDEAKNSLLPLYLVDLNHSNFLVRPTSKGKPEVILVDLAGITSLERLKRSLEQDEMAFPHERLFDLIVDPGHSGVSTIYLPYNRPHSRHSIDKENSCVRYETKKLMPHPYSTISVEGQGIVCCWPAISLSAVFQPVIQ